MLMTNAIATLMTTAGTAIALGAAGLLAGTPAAHTSSPASSHAATTAEVVQEARSGISWSQAGDRSQFERSWQPDDAPRSTVTMIERRGDRTIELTIVDGKASATINGKPVDADRIKQQGDTYFILDGDGREITRMVLLPSATPRTGAWPGEARSIERGVLRPGLAPAEPRFMIGVNISTVSDELKDHLGIKGDAIRVESVMEGMPAEKAGLKAGDLIVSIDGSDGVNAQRLSQTIAKTEGKKPVTIKVIRQGQGMTLSLTPAKAPEEVTIRGRLSFEDEVENITTRELDIEELESFVRQQREEIEKIARSMQSEEERKQLEHSAKALERLTQQLAAERQALRADREQGVARGTLRLRPGAEAEVFRWSTPNAPVAPLPPGMFRFEQGDPQQLERLNEMLKDFNISVDRLGLRFEDIDRQMDHRSGDLDRLNQRLDRMDERMARIERLLERVVEGR